MTEFTFDPRAPWIAGLEVDRAEAERRVAAAVLLGCAFILSDEEEALRRALGAWVSELEPTIIRQASNGRMIGIGYAGRTIVEAEQPRVVMVV